MSDTSSPNARLIGLLAAFHVFIIASSNYLVQIPFTILGLHTTWGAFSFPFVFLATDLTVRLLGAEAARRVVMRVMLPALLLSYLASVLFAEGRFTGWEGLSEFNTFVARIALASFLAYLCGQLLDVQVFNRLRHRARWWLAPSVSSIVGNWVDTMLFFSVAFYASSDPFMAEHWLSIAWFDYGFKIFVSLLLFLPLYGVLLNYLQNKLTHLFAR